MSGKCGEVYCLLVGFDLFDSDTSKSLFENGYALFASVVLGAHSP